MIIREHQRQIEICATMIPPNSCGKVILFLQWFRVSGFGSGGDTRHLKPKLGAFSIGFVR